jgi:hypothetical protein
MGWNDGKRPDESGFLQQLVTAETNSVTPVPDQVRDDGPGVHVVRLKVAGDISSPSGNPSAASF